VAEAVAAGVELDAVYVEEGVSVPDVGAAPVRIVADRVLGRVLDTVTPQPLVAVAALPRHELGDVVAAAARADIPVFVGDRLADPGNVGTIVRSLEAAGGAGLVLTTGSADPFQPKVVRSSAGAVFRLPVVAEVEPADVVAACHEAGVPVWATAMAGGIGHTSADLAGAVAVVLGNEAHGVAPELAAAADGTVSIAMDGPTESLNVAMAATVLAFEARRQRLTRGR
jgi:TrmH family RNA methyltransferase